MPTINLHLRPSSPHPILQPPSSNPLPQLLHTPSGLAILDVQGTLNTPPPPTETSTTSNPASTPVGRIVFAEDGSDKVYLYVGRHQRLTGQVQKLCPPVGVLRLRSRSDSEEEVEVVEVVEWKVVFSQRPEPVS